MHNFNEEDFILAIKTSKTHTEAAKKLGYKGNYNGKRSLYTKYLNKLNPDLSHFGNFTESEFLSAIKLSNSHSCATKILGYTTKTSITGNSRYAKFFQKLKPDTSHFTYIKRSIKFKSKSKKYNTRYIKLRKSIDMNFKIRIKLRNRLSRAINGGYKSGSAVKDLGCSIEKFKLWLEMYWTDGMNWDNYGKGGWVIDHVKPLASFDLSDRSQLLLACHFTNLQPLWELDNLQKSDKF